jgi:leader peptidase (prepilin peptidase)/N-methyltransferase
VALAFVTFRPAQALVAALLSISLVVLSAIDIERGLIPNRIVLPATVAVLLCQLALFSDRGAEWLLAPIALAFVLMLPTMLGRAWMGMGDVKLVLLLGVGLGWGAIGAVMVGFVCVLPAALIVLTRNGLSARKSTLPFGPFLSMGALIVLFAPALAGLSGA